EAETRWRAELEARIRAEVEAKIQAEEAERRNAEETIRRRAEHERILAEEAAKAQEQHEYTFDDVGSSRSDSVRTPSSGDGIHSDAGHSPLSDASPANVTEVTEWFDAEFDHHQVLPKTTSSTSEERFAPIRDDADGEFHPVSLPETSPESQVVS